MTEKAIREWHSRLHNRFITLRSERDATNPGSPVFALEHGLNLDTELQELEDVVRDDVLGGQISKHAWLPLVVYAAEIGYRYEGHEYWPVFENETPGWRQRWPDGRRLIRRRYDSFVLTYGGAQPEGRWASNFTIISWPITHAVLPKDLQKHLARLLSDYRHVFTSELLEDHQELGRWLEARCHDTSSRFRVFAENTELLGLVAASLLLDDEDETALLSADVLHRIVQDLNQERQSGAWLRNAKRAAVQVRRRGLLGRLKSPRRDTPTRISEDAWPKLELDLSLHLFPKGWTVYMTVPSFESFAVRFRNVRNEVERRRYCVKGARGIRARGALMYEQSPLSLETMPTPGQTPLLVEGASRGSRTADGRSLPHAR